MDAVSKKDRLAAKRSAKDRIWSIQTERLRDAIERAGTTATTLAKDLDVGHRTYFRDFLNGKKKSIDAAIMAKTADYLKVDLTWLSGGDEVKKFSVRPVQLAGYGKDIPLLGTATGGIDGRLILSGDVMDLLTRPPDLENVKDPYAVRVDGESMFPRYKAGETVYVNPTRPPRRGDDVVVQVMVKGELSGYVKELVSMDDEKVVACQHQPHKKLSWPRKDVKSVHVIVMADRV